MARLVCPACLFFRCVAVFFVLWVLGRAGTACTHAEDVVPSSVRIVSWNVRNYLDPGTDGSVKPEQSRQAVTEMLLRLRPDICVLIEVGAGPAVREIRARLKESGLDLPFLSVVQGADPVRHIAFLARFQPAEVLHHTNLTYRLRGQMVPVQRGFGHCVFEWPNGYRLHLLAAHLKSKRYNPLGQTDMRRYEARQLHYVIDALLRKDPDANVLVVGDFNDTPNSSPLKTLYARRSRADRQLYDLRPVDRWGFCWTHFWAAGDTYERIDYVLASVPVLSEVVLDGVFIPFDSDWYDASDHRPVVCTIVPSDHPHDVRIERLFDRNIRRRPIAGEIKPRDSRRPRRDGKP